jgi:hypothetical protein
LIYIFIYLISLNLPPPPPPLTIRTDHGWGRDKPENPGAYLKIYFLETQ